MVIMKKIRKHISSIILSIVFVSIAGFIAFKSTQPRVVAPSIDQKNISQQENGEGLVSVTQSIHFNNAIEPIQTTIKVTEGTTALEALEENFEIVKSGEGENAFIKAIKGIEANEKDKTFWAFYVNGKQAEVGAGSYRVNNNDKIEWKLETY